MLAARRAGASPRGVTICQAMYAINPTEAATSRALSVSKRLDVTCGSFRRG